MGLTAVARTPKTLPPQEAAYEKQIARSIPLSSIVAVCGSCLLCIRRQAGASIRCQRETDSNRNAYRRSDKQLLDRCWSESQFQHKISKLCGSFDVSVHAHRGYAGVRRLTPDRTN